MKHSLSAALNYIEGFKDIKDFGVLCFLVLPGIITCIMLWIFYVLANPYLSSIESWIIHMYPFTWGKGVITWIVGTFSFFIWVGGFLFFFKYILFVVMSPFMSVFSEKIESSRSAPVSSPRLNLKIIISEFIRGLRIAVRNFSREIFIVAFLLVLSFVPGLQLVTGPLIFLVQAYYAGAGNFDYVLERKCSIAESLSFNRRNRSVLVANGAVFLLLLSVPFIGWFLAAPLGTSSATRTYLSINQDGFS